MNDAQLQGFRNIADAMAGLPARWRTSPMPNDTNTTPGRDWPSLRDIPVSGISKDAAGSIWRKAAWLAPLGDADPAYMARLIDAKLAPLLAALRDTLEGLDAALPCVPKKRHVHQDYKNARVAQESARKALADAGDE